MFRRFCVDFSSIWCQCLLEFLSIFGPYSVRIIARVHRTQHKPALRLRIRPPQNGPTYCIVPLVVLQLNVMICDRTCAVIYNAVFISTLDFDRFLPVFCRSCVDLSSVLCRFFVSFLSTFAWLSVHIGSIFGQYSVRMIAHHRNNQHKSALPFQIRPSTSGPTYCIIPLIERPTYYIMTEYNNL